MLWLLQYLDGESSSGEAPVPQIRSIGECTQRKVQKIELFSLFLQLFFVSLASISDNVYKDYKQIFLQESVAMFKP
jgi:hypothetical protein